LLIRLEIGRVTNVARVGTGIDRLSIRLEFAAFFAIICNGDRSTRSTKTRCILNFLIVGLVCFLQRNPLLRINIACLYR